MQGDAQDVPTAGNALQFPIRPVLEHEASILVALALVLPQAKWAMKFFRFVHGDVQRLWLPGVNVHVEV